MKKLISLLALVILMGCPNPSGGNPPGSPPGNPPDTSSPPPAGLSGPVKAALYDGATVRLWDGVNAVAWKTGAAVRGNGRKIAVGRTLYFLDASGGVTSTMNLPADPSGVAVVGDPVVYTFQTITNAEAFALDYSPPQSGGGYTRIWQDGVELGDWHSNGWFFDHSYTVACGDIIAVDNLNRFHDISQPALSPYQMPWAIPDGPLFYVPDMGTPNTLVVYDATGAHTVVATGGNVTDWNGQPWMQAADGKWYDGLGQVWDPVAHTFATHANAMQQFSSTSNVVSTGGYSYHDAGQYPVMLQAYADASNVYFVECVSGALVSFTPQTNTAAVVEFAYAGDGMRSTGMAQALTLDPSLVDGALYYHQGGNLWQMNTTTTVVSSFSADQQMWVMK